MPMDRGGLRKPVRQVHLENITNLRLQGWARDLTVEAPSSCSSTWLELPFELSRLELRGDDSTPRIGLRRLEGAGIGLLPVGRRFVHHHMITVAMVFMVTAGGPMTSMPMPVRAMLGTIWHKVSYLLSECGL
jgi:hypothetical protein